MDSSQLINSCQMPLKQLQRSSQRMLNMSGWPLSRWEEELSRVETRKAGYHSQILVGCTDYGSHTEGNVGVHRYFDCLVLYYTSTTWWFKTNALCYYLECHVFQFTWPVICKSSIMVYSTTKVNTRARRFHYCDLLTATLNTKLLWTPRFISLFTQ